MAAIKIFTIGFTKKKAEYFFEALKRAGVKRVVDVRLNNVSQLAGFAKRDDLKYFLEKIAGIEYIHRPELAPTQDILDAYKKHKGDWATYKHAFNRLMQARRIEEVITQQEVDAGCLLCSEHQPHHCHRTLVAEYLSKKWGTKQVQIEHLATANGDKTGKG